MSKLLQPRARSRRGRDALTLVTILLLTAAARSSLANHYIVPTGSMQPTVEIGDRIFVDQRAYGLRLPFAEGWLARHRAPRPGDVVVLRSPDDARILLKRVAAVPGDRVEVRGGRLLRNGHQMPLDEAGDHWLEWLEGRAHPVRLGGPDFGPVTVPEDRFLVLGDNRGNSRDGRSFGLVEGGSIRGRAVGVWLRDGRPTWQEL